MREADSTNEDQGEESVNNRQSPKRTNNLCREDLQKMIGEEYGASGLCNSEVHHNIQWRTEMRRTTSAAT